MIPETLARWCGWARPSSCRLSRTGLLVLLGLLASSPIAGQSGPADAGLSDGNTASMRIAAFGALAESARINGNLLRDHHAAALVEAAINEADLRIRMAAGVALGALDLPSNKAGQIITKYHKG